MPFTQVYHFTKFQFNCYFKYNTLSMIKTVKLYECIIIQYKGENRDYSPLKDNNKSIDYKNLKKKKKWPKILFLIRKVPMYST